jgi:hypothetical protein
MPRTDREHPDVVKAHAIGAVACPRCNGVHVDFVDEGGNIVATAFLDFDPWHRLVIDVDRDIVVMEGGLA